MICSVAGCSAPVKAARLCNKHYLRQRIHGDPLHLKMTEPGAPIRFFRDVVLPYDGDECLIWPYGRDQNGYARITPVEGGTGYVSRLVCEEAHGAPPTPEHEAAHNCGRGGDGCVTKRHLIWKTSKENKADELLHGTRNFGTRNGAAKLGPREALAIRSLCASGDLSQSEIAVRFGITQTAVSKIHLRKTWAHLEDGDFQ